MLDVYNQLTHKLSYPEVRGQRHFICYLELEASVRMQIRLDLRRSGCMSESMVDLEIRIVFDVVDIMFITAIEVNSRY
jgi:hypothetical protein